MELVPHVRVFWIHLLFCMRCIQHISTLSHHGAPIFLVDDSQIEYGIDNPHFILKTFQLYEELNNSVFYLFVLDYIHPAVSKFLVQELHLQCSNHVHSLPKHVYRGTAQDSKTIRSCCLGNSISSLQTSAYLAPLYPQAAIEALRFGACLNRTCLVADDRKINDRGLDFREQFDCLYFCFKLHTC